MGADTHNPFGAIFNWAFVEREKALALFAVLLAGVLGFMVMGDGEETATGPLPDSAAEQNARTSVWTAQTAIETYSADNDGLFEGATVEALVAESPTLRSASLAIPRAEADAYTVSVVSEGSVTYSISRNANGQVYYTCAPAGDGGCAPGGTWDPRD